MKIPNRLHCNSSIEPHRGGWKIKTRSGEGDGPMKHLLAPNSILLAVILSAVNTPAIAVDRTFQIEVEKPAHQAARGAGRTPAFRSHRSEACSHLGRRDPSSYAQRILVLEEEVKTRLGHPEPEGLVRFGAPDVIIDYFHIAAALRRTSGNPTVQTSGRARRRARFGS